MAKTYTLTGLAAINYAEALGIGLSSTNPTTCDVITDDAFAIAALVEADLNGPPAADWYGQTRDAVATIERRLEAARDQDFETVELITRLGVPMAAEIYLYIRENEITHELVEANDESFGFHESEVTKS